jgi:hypothetical protein
MALEEYFTIWESETIVFHELELSLKAITRDIIPADPIDDSIPEWEWIFITFEFNLNGKKKTTKLSQLSEPYQSILEQSWKDYKLVVKKVKDNIIKFKISYNWVV